MKKIILISDVIPDPEGTGSEQRAYSFLRAYAKICSVELWCHPRPDNPNARRIFKVHDLVSEIYFYFPYIMTPANLLTKRLEQSLREAHAVHMFKFPLRIAHSRIIWDIDELPRELKNTKVPLVYNEFPSISMPETIRQIEFAHECKMVITSSDYERSSLLGNMVTVPNCYHSEHIDINRIKSKTLMFVGHLGYEPNIEAIKYFYNQIFKQLPADFRFRIVGKSPSLAKDISLLSSISSDHRVEIHYDVPSCSPFYSDALAAVVPLLDGQGTRLKILEAFAHKCPVISTSKGCEGLNVVNEQELVICDTADAFISACDRIDKDKKFVENLTSTALHFLECNNSQKVMESLLFKALEEHVPSIFE